MTDEEIRKIVDQRLGKWGDDLVDYHSTPLILLAVGHDHNSGQLHIETVVEVPDWVIIGFLKKTILMMEGKG